MPKLSISHGVPTKVQQFAKIGEVIRVQDLAPSTVGEMLHYAHVWGAEVVFHQQHPANISIDGKRVSFYPDEVTGQQQIREAGAVSKLMTGHFLMSNDRTWWFEYRQLADYDAPLVPVPIDMTDAFWACRVHGGSAAMVCYSVGCTHKRNTSRTTANCYHEHTCLDCGHRWAVDSSG